MNPTPYGSSACSMYSRMSSTVSMPFGEAPLLDPFRFSSLAMPSSVARNSFTGPVFVRKSTMPSSHFPTSSPSWLGELQRASTNALLMAKAIFALDTNSACNKSEQQTEKVSVVPRARRSRPRSEGCLSKTTGSPALPESESTILTTGSSALLSSVVGVVPHSPFGCGGKTHVGPAFYRQRHHCREKDFPVPVTGLSGVQNASDMQEKDFQKKPAREVAFSWAT
jgi:hypothetical protein